MTKLDRNTFSGWYVHSIVRQKINYYTNIISEIYLKFLFQKGDKYDVFDFHIIGGYKEKIDWLKFLNKTQ